MSQAQLITNELIEKAKKYLMSLPPKNKVTPHIAAITLGSAFKRGLKLGYTIKEIQEILEKEGITLSIQKIKFGIRSISSDKNDTDMALKKSSKDNAPIDNQEKTNSSEDIQNNEKSPATPQDTTENSNDNIQKDSIQTSATDKAEIKPLPTTNIDGFTFTDIPLDRL